MIAIDIELSGHDKTRRTVGCMDKLPVMSEPQTGCRWPAPQAVKSSLGQNEVHVWGANLEECANAISELYPVLSPDERVRAARFKFPRDRDYFIIEWGLLRRLLSSYRPLPPDQHQFLRGPHGKPELAQSREEERLYFNMSHSSSMALFAFARTVAVGVDIEHIRPMEDWEGIARNFFSTNETKALRKLPEHKRLDAFFNCWTRKEAVLKATGQGVTGGVDGVEVTVSPTEPACVLNAIGEAESALGWSLHALVPAGGYVGAVAYQGPRLGLECRAVSLANLRS